jgi:TetR/AcrR family transcriptional regulator, transcriptional repressor for nem operon
MPRAKEFDETEVLDHALEIFRLRGFSHTSFEDLTRELSVSRQSLYDTYGDKSALFHAALRRYLDRALDYVRRQLDDPRPVRAVLAGLFEGMNTANCGRQSPGCLMVNSMVELAPHDPAMRTLAHRHARSVEGLLASRIGAAQRAGEIGRDKDPAALARFLYHVMLGLGVASRAFGERGALGESVRLALRSLD